MTTNGLVAGWKKWARDLKQEVYAVGLALKDPRCPWYAKILAACVVAYALSPIDLIPDPIPVLGYLDDLILVPIGMAIVRKLIPAEVLAECRVRAAGVGMPPSRLRWIGLLAIITLWAASLALMACLIARHWSA